MYLDRRSSVMPRQVIRILSKHFFRDAVSQGESDLQSPLRVASKFLQDQVVRERQNENPIIDPRHEWSLSVWNLVGGTRTSAGSLVGREREGGGGCTISFSISSMRGNSFLNLWPIKYLQLPHGKDTEVEKFDRVFKAPTSL